MMKANTPTSNTPADHVADEEGRWRSLVNAVVENMYTFFNHNKMISLLLNYLNIVNLQQLKWHHSSVVAIELLFRFLFVRASSPERSCKSTQQGFWDVSQ
jgi:hypothetical protein